MQQRFCMSKQAVIYCRVSSDKQVKDGNGLDSQESNCRKYATLHNLGVIKVFKDEGISGNLDISKRPGLRNLFTFLAKNQKQSLVIITDDLSRIARDVHQFTCIKKEIKNCGSELHTVNNKREDTAEGRFMENIEASQAQYARELNAIRTKSRMMAHAEQGYYVFNPPFGYKRTRDQANKICLVRDEPIASILQEALEGFAKGRFTEQKDVHNFLQANEAILKRQIHLSFVKRLLINEHYTGYFSHPDWNIGYQKWHMESIISIETFNINQERLTGKMKAAYRKDITNDFPLRGFVLCAECGKPLTASWSTGRKNKHPYYRCKNQICKFGGKSIKRDKIENDLSTLLGSITPDNDLLTLTKAIAKDVYNEKLRDYENIQKNCEKIVIEHETEIAKLIKLIMNTENETLRRLYEGKLTELEECKTKTECELATRRVNTPNFETALECVFNFVKNPRVFYVSGDLQTKRTVLNLVFAKNMEYDNKKGFGTAAKSLLFRLVEANDKDKLQLASPTGVEPVLLP